MLNNVPTANSLNLEHLRKQAKSMLKEIQKGSPSALARLTTVHPAKQDDIKLADTQLIIAREHGFPWWPKLKAYTESISGANADRFRAIERNISYYDDRAGGLLSQHKSGLIEASIQIKNAHPRLKLLDLDEISNAPFSIDDARLVTAVEHGHTSWQGLSQWVERLTKGEVIEPFEMAFQAIKEGNDDLLVSWLQRDPSLARARGTNANSLLSLAVSFHRLTMAEVLLANGADVNAANVRGWTSLHQAANNQILPIAELLLEHGADSAISALGDGGTPLVTAGFWGHDRAVDLLAKRCGVIPRNLRAAAASGDLEMIWSFFSASGELLPQAGDRRGFYRPHSGFPVMRPSSSPREIIDEAFVYASVNGRIAALKLLLEFGADINGDPYRGTALHRVMTKKALTPIAQWLIDHGAEVNLRATFGGHGYGERVTALHVAAASGNIENAKLLIAHGAEINAIEDVYQSTPAGWAEHFGNSELAEIIKGSAN